MVDVVRGAPLIDVLAPRGSASAAADIQTRMELAGGGGWRIQADDGTMEQSMLPSQPLRGGLDRIWAARHTPMYQGESMQESVALGMELAISLQAPLAAVGVYGVVGWGLVLFEEARWLYGLTLLEWVYNPRLGLDGAVLEDGDEDPEAAETAYLEKLRLFPQLWTPEATSRFVTRVPQGAIQTVESHQALSLMGPGGSFDPRYWQSFAVQMALAEVQLLAQHPGGGPVPASAKLGAATGPSAPAVKPAPAKPAAPKEPGDGLTPLQRARRKAAEATTGDAPPTPAAAPALEEHVGEPLRWVADAHGPVLVIPQERFDDGLVRSLQGGSQDGLSPGEAPDGKQFEEWVEAGGPFVTQVPFLSRLFLDNSPLHAQAFTERSADDDGLAVMDCHLPRVSRVRLVRGPALEGGRPRWLVSSDPARSGRSIVALFG